MSYWSKTNVSRRRALQLGAVVGSVASLSLIGCSSDDAKTNTSDRDAKLDATKGVPGGTLKFHYASEWTSLNPTAAIAQGRFVGLTNSGLLRLSGGQWGYDPGDPSLEPDLAIAMPETPDATTLIFKLRPGVQFHNGRPLTVEDVKYSYEAFAKAPAFASGFAWLDKIETPDAQTVTFKLKYPDVEAINQMAGRYVTVLAKEVQESADAGETLMGTGPFKLVKHVVNNNARFERNPNYHLKPFPYFDAVEGYLGTVDAKRVADVVSGQVDLPFWFGYGERDQLKEARPDMTVEENSFASFLLVMRTDTAPYKDVRVRKALSMSMDRDKINKGVFNGEGQPDTPFGINQRHWGARPADQLPGTLSKHFVLDIAEAKKLLSAAGITGPIKDKYTHPNSSGPSGQVTVDAATLAMAGWRAAGIADFDVTEIPFSLNVSTLSTGNYEGVGQVLRGPANLSYGFDLRNLYYSDANGPVRNNASRYVSAILSALLDKQQVQADLTERRKTFREIEELTAEELAYIPFTTFTGSWFFPPKLQNARMPLIFGTATAFQKWWFAKS